MMAQQRDVEYNSDWVNHEGYNDSTAGQALNRIMYQQQRKPQSTAAPVRRTEVWRAPETTALPKELPPLPTQQKSDADLKRARSVYNVFGQILALCGFTLTDISIKDKLTGHLFTRDEMQPPLPQSKKGE